MDGRGERGGGETPGGGDHDDVAQKDREWEQALAIACGSDSIHELDDAALRSAENGEMSETIVTRPASATSFAVSATRLTFSALSRSVKPKSLFNPCRRLSPSNTIVARPEAVSAWSTKLAIVDLPAPERPVSQATRAKEENAVRNS